MKKVLFVLLVAFITGVVLAQSNSLYFYKVVDDFKKADAKVDKAIATLDKAVHAKAGYQELFDKEFAYHIALSDQLRALAEMVSLDQTGMPDNLKTEIYNLVRQKRSATDGRILEAAHRAMRDAGPQAPVLPKPRDLHLP